MGCDSTAATLAICELWLSALHLRGAEDCQESPSCRPPCGLQDHLSEGLHALLKGHIHGWGSRVFSMYPEIISRVFIYVWYVSHFRKGVESFYWFSRSSACPQVSRINDQESGVKSTYPKGPQRQSKCRKQVRWRYERDSDLDTFTFKNIDK